MEDIEEKLKNDYLLVDVDNIGGKVVKSDERYVVTDNTILEDLVLSSTMMHPNKATNGHVHKGQEEIYSFISGSGTMWLDDKKFNVKAGDIVLIEDGVFHKVASGDYGIYFVCVFNGGRK